MKIQSRAMNKLLILITISFSLWLTSCSKAPDDSNKNRINNSSSHSENRGLSSKSIEPSLFFEQTMNPKPFLPKDTQPRKISCDLPEVNASTHLTSQEANYADYGWEQRVAHDWSFFDVPSNTSNTSDTSNMGRILLIDIKQKDGLPAYRYLANSTHTQRYEPWSSSKIFAYTGAMAQLRISAKNMNADNPIKVSEGLIGEHHIADMITSINSYDPFGKADGNSNALATFFANLATRQYLTGLFYDEWLKLSTPNISFSGAYGPTAFSPSEFTWRANSSSKNQNNDVIQTMPINMNNIASEDPGYLPYRCDNCGLTGNKPMTTLAQAEWLKRLAMHSDDSSTAHPELTQGDVDTLFYGTGNSESNEQMAGMTLGISTMLQQAIAKTLDAQHASPTSSKAILDKATNGKWRVFQKIGWGPSETRSTSENVVLAYVCLPEYKGGRAFVVAAQAAVADAKDENVALAGLKMQALLDNAIAKYLETY
jgi:hypothetical protein